MQKKLLAIFLVMAMALIYGCSTKTAQTKPKELTPIVNTDNLTKREDAFSNSKPYNDDDLFKSISEFTTKASAFTSANHKSMLLIALQFDKGTPRDDVSAFKEAINGLSKNIVNSGYEVCQFFLVSDGDVRLTTAPLSISNGEFDSASTFFHYSESKTDTQYADAENE